MTEPRTFHGNTRRKRHIEIRTHESISVYVQSNSYYYSGLHWLLISHQSESKLKSIQRRIERAAAASHIRRRTSHEHLINNDALGSGAPLRD